MSRNRRDRLAMRVLVDEHSGDECPSDFEQYLTDCLHFYENLDIDVQMDSGGMSLVDDIMGVWGGYNDFDSRDYIAFVMTHNALEYREANTWQEAQGELCDQIICAMRALHEAGVDPETAVRWRLRERMDGSQEDIISKYKARYRNAVAAEASDREHAADGGVRPPAMGRPKRCPVCEYRPTDGELDDTGGACPDCGWDPWGEGDE